MIRETYAACLAGKAELTSYQQANFETIREFFAEFLGDISV